MRINKSTQTIGQIERGIFAPSLDTIEAISRALNAPPALLFPPTASGKKPTAKDELLSSIVSHAARLTKDDMELLKLISAALFERRRSA